MKPQSEFPPSPVLRRQRLLGSTLPTLPALLAAACLGMAPVAATADPASLRETLARGLVAEEVNRDLEAARREYESVLASFADQRAVAASALFRLAEIHRAQGRQDEAVAHYQRLLREFPDAEREIDLARRQLAAWDIAVEQAGLVDGQQDAEELELQRLRKLRQSRPDVFRKSTEELVTAIESNWNRALAYLLSEGLDPGQALRIAGELGSLEAVKTILAGGHKPDAAAVREAVVSSVANEYHEIFDHLVATKLDFNSQDGERNRTNMAYGTVLHQLAYPANLEKIRRLIDAGADVNAICVRTGFTPLQVAIYHSDSILGDFPALVKLLLDKGADLKPLTTRREPFWRENVDNPEASLSALELAMDRNRPDLVALLIDRGADAKQENLLAKACSLPGGIEIVRLLLDRGADPNAPADHPPIIRAFENFDSSATPNEQSARHRQQVSLIRLLLERGADPNTKFDTFTRQWVIQAHAQRSGEGHHGLGLFADRGAQAEELPAGLFHQVIRLYRTHRMLNLDLVKILLEAGAVPGQEFPEIFTFVATGGQSARTGSGIIHVDGDAEPAEIARALLAHRPAEIDLEHLQGARGWDPGVRRMFFDEVAYPMLAKDGSITLSFLNRVGGYPKLLEAGQAVPDTATLMFRNLEQLSLSTLTRVRRAADGTWQRTAIDWQGDDPLPEFQAGDIVETEVESAAPSADVFRWAIQKRLPAFAVTLEIDGAAREITIRPDLLAFDPSRDEAPMLDATALARLLGQGLDPEGVPDPLQQGTLILRRDAWPDLTLGTSAGGTKPLALEAGDHLIVERDPNLQRNDDISLAIPGKPFLRTFSSNVPPTLVQAIADAWSQWHEISANIKPPQDDEASLAWRARLQAGPGGENYVSTVPRGPDFSKIRIRRIDAEGTEFTLEVDLESPIRACTDDTPAAEVRLADVALQAGDIIEIPLRETNADAPWRGFSAETVRFFDKVLSARFVLIHPHEGVQQREFRYQPPRWTDGPHGLIALPPASGSPTARFPAIANGEGYTGKLLRGGASQAINSTEDWFIRDGDQVTGSPSPGLPRPAVVPRMRTPVQPPPR